MKKVVHRIQYHTTHNRHERSYRIRHIHLIMKGSCLSLIERSSPRITTETIVVGCGFEASKVGGVTGLGEIHANGLSRVGGLEAAFEVIEGRLSISDNGRFVGKVEGTLRIVVVFRTGTDDICV